jgi:hypothetical protein
MATVLFQLIARVTIPAIEASSAVNTPMLRRVNGLATL